MARRTKKNEKEIALAVFSNEPTAIEYDLLQMIYMSAFSNQLGFMHAKHKETGEIHRLLVGTEWNSASEKLDVYPLARFLEPEEVSEYLSPDGNGNYE